MKHPKSLPKAKLTDLIEKIICRLYEDHDGNFDKDREWDSDTLSDVAGFLARLGLTPEDSHGKPVSGWMKAAKPCIRKVSLYCATIHTRSGVEILVAPSEALLDEQLYEYVRGEWDHSDLPGMPEDADEAVEMFFESGVDELYRDLDTVTIGIEE